MRFRLWDILHSATAETSLKIANKEQINEKIYGNKW